MHDGHWSGQPKHRLRVPNSSSFKVTVASYNIGIKMSYFCIHIWEKVHCIQNMKNDK